jgi:hypothetical protein
MNESDPRRNVRYIKEKGKIRHTYSAILVLSEIYTHKKGRTWAREPQST